LSYGKRPRERSIPNKTSSAPPWIKPLIFFFKGLGKRMGKSGRNKLLRAISEGIKRDKVRISFGA
jgi:hypothetical protein